MTSVGSAAFSLTAVCTFTVFWLVGVTLRRVHVWLADGEVPLGDCHKPTFVPTVVPELSTSRFVLVAALSSW